MTDYNDGQWHNWDGGPCPVHPKSVVDVVWHGTKSGTIGMFRQRRAFEPDWPRIAWDKVIRFRVVKAHCEPREWWINVYATGLKMMHSTKDEADRDAGRSRIECVHVREVVDGEE